jgi:hypothetical protein
MYSFSFVVARTKPLLVEEVLKIFCMMKFVILCTTSETVFHCCYVNDLHTTHAVVCWVTTKAKPPEHGSKGRAPERRSKGGAPERTSNLFKTKPPNVGQIIFKAKPPSVGRIFLRRSPRA